MVPTRYEFHPLAGRRPCPWSLRNPCRFSPKNLPSHPTWSLTGSWKTVFPRGFSGELSPMSVDRPLSRQDTRPCSTSSKNRRSGSGAPACHRTTGRSDEGSTARKAPSQPELSRTCRATPTNVSRQMLCLNSRRYGWDPVGNL